MWIFHTPDIAVSMPPLSICIRLFRIEAYIDKHHKLDRKCTGMAEEQIYTVHRFTETNQREDDSIFTDVY